MNVFREYSELIVALSSLVIATLALALTYYEAYSNRKHYRLSVKPKLQLGSSVGHPQSEAKLSVDITLTNSGLGPALIRKYLIYYNGEIIFDNRQDSDMKRISSIIEREFAQYIRQKTSSAFGPEAWLPSDERLILLGVEILTDNEDIKDRFRSFFSKISVEINYESIYGEAFSSNMRNAPSL